MIYKKLTEKKSNALISYFFIYSITFLVLTAIVLHWIWYWGFALTQYGDDIGQHYMVLLYLHDWYREVVKTMFVEHSLNIPHFDLALGYGSDIYTTFSYYGIFDPFYVLSVFVDKSKMDYFFWFLMVLRLYLSGVNFSAYFFTHTKKLDAVLFGAIIYCFSGFVLNAAFHQLMFMNAMVYFPLLLMGADRIFNKEKGTGLFSIMVAATLIINFYWSYMMILLTVIYCVFVYLDKVELNIKTFVGVLSDFILKGIVGVLISGVVSIPVFYMLHDSGRIKAEVNIPFLYDFRYYLDLFSHFFTTERNQSTYLGFVPVALAGIVVMYIKPGNKMLKIAFAFLSLLLLFPYFGHVFNGFSYVSNRWTFGYAFAVAFVFVKLYPVFLTLKDKEKNLLLVVTVLFSLVIISNRFTRTEWTVSELCLAILYIFVICRLKESEYNKLFYATGLVIVVGVFLTTTYVYSYKEGNDLESQRTKLGQTYKCVMEDNPANVVDVKDSDKLYRVEERAALKYRNQFFVKGLSSTSFYYSTSNSAIGCFNKELGVNEPLDYSYSNLDNRMILNALAGVRYYLVKQGDDKYIPYGFVYKKSKEINGQTYDLYYNNYYLPMAYSYKNAYPKKYWDNLNFVQKQKVMMEAAVIDDSPLDDNIDTSYSEVEYECECGPGVQISDSEITVNYDGGEMILRLLDAIGGSETYLIIEGLEFTSLPKEYDKERLYTKYKQRIDNNNISKSTVCGIAVEASNGVNKQIVYITPNNEFYCGIDSFLCNVGYSEEAIGEMKLTLPQGKFKYKKITVACQKVDECINNISEIKSRGLKNIKYKDNMFEAEIAEEQPSYVCVTIPYSSGWKAELDGRQTEITRCNSMWMGLKCDKGKHQIKLRYHTPGMKAGVILSVVGLFLLILLKIKTLITKIGSVQ
ncbi:MAG: YfhO family protein [Lachnospiraceae bacterium]|nr:YfhO family protein [Lachnospiraceae bacterium]